MPAARIWSEADDNYLREVNGSIPLRQIAEQMGCGPTTVNERERHLGIKRGDQKPPAPQERPTRSKYYAGLPYVRDEFPLPAGHPASWTAISDEPWPYETGEP